MPTIEQIDACLPQTQCTKCSYPGCREYAQAIQDGNADINQCPPGGEVTIGLLAKVLNRPAVSLNTDYGEHARKRVAKIIEKDCIGCMLCIKACPVDAIIGSNKLMHSIIETECTGCDLCLPPCPMDCIEMVPAVHSGCHHNPWQDYSYLSTNQSRIRRNNRLSRLDQKADEKSKMNSSKGLDRKKVIEDAIRRARNKSA